MNTILDIKKDVQNVVEKAGEILLSFFGNTLSQKNKAGMGFVTEADLASEAFLIEQLLKIVPGASIYAEESGQVNQKNNEYCWVIDPLDGTTNFAHSLPYFCISVALTYKSDPILAFVYQPVLKELFWAIKGGGAFLHDIPIYISTTSRFEDTFLCAGIPYIKDKAYNKRFMRAFAEIIKETFAFRHFGAVALDLAYVACGRLDAIFFEDMAWWDFAAGKLLIQEAGGIITDFNNNAIQKDSRSFIGANKDIHKELLDILWLE